MRAWAHILALSVCGAACRPAPIEVEGLADAAFVAALLFDRGGELVQGGPVRITERSVILDPFTDADHPLVLVGWPAGTFDPSTVSSDPVRARQGCEPALPEPSITGYVGPRPPSDPIVPQLAVAWAGACPDLDLARLSFDLRCREARCPWKLARTGPCTFDLDFGSCLDVPLSMRMDAGGGVCVTGPSCGRVATDPPASSTFECSAPACAVDVYITPEAPRVRVERVKLLGDVAPFEPLAGLPGDAYRTGYAGDFAVVGDRVLVSNIAATNMTSCSANSGMTAYALDDLREISRAPAPPCPVLLAASGTVAIGLYLEGDRFILGAFDRDLTRTRFAELGARGIPPACDDPIELHVEGDQAYLACVSGTRSNVYVIELPSLRVTAQHELPDPYVVRARVIGTAFWVGRSFDLLRYRLGEFTSSQRFEISKRSENRAVLLDFDVDQRGQLVTALGYPASSLRRDRGDGAFEDRAFRLEREAIPVAIWPRAFADGHGLVLTMEGWDTTASLLDGENFVILPGGVPVGRGVPRRLRSDGRGGVLALMPWEATLVRIPPY